MGSEIAFLRLDGRLALPQLDSGLLLGEAVEGAEAPDEVGAVDADDATVGEEVL